MPSPSPEQKPDESASKQGPLGKIFLSQLPLEKETSQFILVNVLDFFMTYWLLMSGEFRESNPVAAYFLHSWGPVKGMLLYKLSLVTVVCLIAQIVALKRLETARRLLRFGTLVAACVVIYGVTLFVRQTW